MPPRRNTFLRFSPQQQIQIQRCQGAKIGPDWQITSSIGAREKINFLLNIELGDFAGGGALWDRIWQAEKGVVCQAARLAEENRMLFAR